MNIGVMLAIVLSAGVLLVALVVATAMVLRAVRGLTVTKPPSKQSRYRADDATVRLQAVLDQAEAVVRQFDGSLAQLADLSFDMRRFDGSVAQLADLSFDMRRFDGSVAQLADAQPTIAPSTSNTEISDSRIVAELNHALQTPLRGLGYAVHNLENLPDDVLLKERAKRLADMTAMLDSCTAALATFRGLVNTVGSVPARQPSLDEAIRAFTDTIPYPAGEPVMIDFVGLPDRVDKFSNHYLLTMLQPLVANAIEGCAPGGSIEITFADHGDAVEFTVFNPVDRPVDKEILFAPRRTTKDRHEGLGVSIVQRLAEFVRGDLIADTTDTGVRMRVVLPRR